MSNPTSPAPRFRRAIPLLIAVIAVPTTTGLNAQTPELQDAVEVALAMPSSIDYAEWDRFIGLFADDAVMFFPFTSRRANNRSEIEAVMKPIFDRNKDRLPGPIFGFEPTEVTVAPLGEEGAVVSWFMRNGDTAQRRSVALRIVGGQWKIVLVHADNRSG